MKWWDNLPLLWKMLSAVGVVLLLAVVVNLFALASTRNARGSSAWADHSQRVIAQIEDARVAVYGMATAYRGFLLAGQDTFVAAYDLHRQAFDTTIRELQRDTADNPDQLRRWQDAERRVVAW